TPAATDSHAAAPTPGADSDPGRTDVDDPVVDEPATAALRARLAAERGAPPMFDRGPGYPRLANGATQADVD
ncbi:MAG TPA: hypothetical protein VGO78_02240, partial [Acidimicrobiales bacterium]|nr:hypothetical protein [Acidimicrobiales bacterium]